ncbi:Aluminum-activated malate transporter 12 isoform B [Glycine soja]|uniref:Aluminum-activated malate transporter 12 isoform B n=1 Tax=Glycine soja TaxID=3848 RepID=A0A445F384_GLYSO|nr:Aluminum-activated malate transporter 12 isoform B [Glycine soja]
MITTRFCEKLKLIQALKVSMAETNTSIKSSRQLRYIYSYAHKLNRFPGLARKAIWKVGKEDPRRVVHSMKVGTALVLVSLLYLLEPLFNGIGKNAMWAVMTVVVVMEFTVGATLCKGLNRGLGTLLAGSLAFLIKYFADAPGRIFQAVYIGVSVFMIGALTTYVRFIPSIKKNYDYGVLIFLLTFNLITVSSYRVNDVWDFAKDRISTIAIGCGLCLLMSILVFPNWSGEELHNNTISRLEGLANSIQVCITGYFYDSAKQATEGDSSENPIYEGYKAVLDSKVKDETLASQASWEPRFSRYCHRTPWHQYTRVGAALRQFSYTVVALHGCLQSEIQTPKSISTLYKDSCIRLGEEVSKVLRELANSIRNKRQFSPQTLSRNLKDALQDLHSALKSQPQLVLGSRNGRTQTPKTAVQAVPHPHPDQKLEEDTKFSFSSVRNGSRGSGCQSVEHSRELTRKVLRPQMSMSAIISLEFSEALPFAAFTSLLVEMVAKLDYVMDEVDELGIIAHFEEFQGDEIVVTCEKPNINKPQNDLPSYGAE